MTTDIQQYLLNKLDSELSLQGGYLNIPARSFAPIRPSDVTDVTIEYALRRDWAEVTDTKPTGTGVNNPRIAVEIVEPYRGLTFDELQAELTAKAAKAAEDESFVVFEDPVSEPEVFVPTAEVFPGVITEESKDEKEETAVAAPTEVISEVEADTKVIKQKKAK